MVPFVLKSPIGVDERLAQMATCITVESSNEEQLFLSKLADPDKVMNKIMHVLPGVHEDISYAERDRTYVFSNGRYVKNKGMLSVIKCCKELNIPVVTAGTIQNDLYYQECLAEEYGEVLGHLSKRELSDLYNKSKVYVCASWYELSSASVCEAIACKCLVLSTSKHVANSNWHEEGYFTFDSEEEMKEKLISLYHSDHKQCNSYWDAAKLVAEYNNVFIRCAQRRNILWI